MRNTSRQIIRFQTNPENYLEEKMKVNSEMIAQTAGGQHPSQFTDQLVKPLACLRPLFIRLLVILALLEFVCCCVLRSH